MLDRHIIQNEQDLYTLQRQKIQTLERQVLVITQNHDDFKLKYNQLQSDYNHNLQVIQDRDQELDEITEKLLQLKQISESRNKELIVAQSKLEETEQVYKRHISELKDLCEQYRHESKQKQKTHELEINEFKIKLQQTQKELDTIRFQKNSQKQYLLQKTEETYKEKIESYQEQIHKLNKQISSLNTTIENDQLQIQKQGDDLTIQNQRIQSLQKQLSDQTNQAQNDNVQLKQKIQQQQLIINQFKKDLEQNMQTGDQVEQTLQQKVLQLVSEKEQISYQFLDFKQKKKLKIKSIKESSQRALTQLQKELEERIKRTDFQNQQQTIEIEKLLLQQSHLRDKCNEMEQSKQHQTQEYEQKILQLQKNNDLDKNQHKVEIEHRRHQIKQLEDEIQKLKGTIQEQNTLMDSLAHKLQELKSENQILINEVVSLRKNKPTQLYREDIPVKKAQPHNSHQKQQYINDAEEVESFEKLFSDDEGPVKSHLKSISKSYKQQLQKSKLKDLENENNKLKNIINDLNLAMEGAKDKLMQKVHELSTLQRECQQLKDKLYQLQENSSYQKQQIEQNHQVEIQLKDQIRETSHQHSKEIDQLVKKLEQSKAMIIQLRKERDELLEITSDLNQKLRDADNNSEIIQMQQELKLLQHQLTQQNSRLMNPANKQQQQPEKPKDTHHDLPNFNEIMSLYK